MWNRLSLAIDSIVASEREHLIDYAVVVFLFFRVIALQTQPWCAIIWHFFTLERFRLSLFLLSLTGYISSYKHILGPFNDRLIFSKHSRLEFFLEAEKLGYVEEKLEAVFEHIVLTAHLRRVVKRLQIIKNTDPLCTSWDLPAVRQNKMQHV